MLEKMKAEFEKWHRFPVTDDMDIQTEVAWMNWQAAWNAGISAATGWRDVVDELPNEAQEVLFVRHGKTVHGAWIGGIFWHSNQKCAAATWRPMPLPPCNLQIMPTCTNSQTGGLAHNALGNAPRFSAVAVDRRVMRDQPKENEVKVKLEMVIELGEMDVGDLATAIKREIRAMDIPNPDGGVMFLEHLSVVVKEVESSKNLPEVPTCTKSQTPIDWGRVERAEALGVAVHVTPAINEECRHDWENGEDGSPERCGKCGLSFTRYVHSCCP